MLHLADSSRQTHGYCSVNPLLGSLQAARCSTQVNAIFSLVMSEVGLPFSNKSCGLVGAVSSNKCVQFEPGVLLWVLYDPCPHYHRAT
jgi:hypothetical protein